MQRARDWLLAATLATIGGGGCVASDATWEFTYEDSRAFAWATMLALRPAQEIIVIGEGGYFGMGGVMQHWAICTTPPREYWLGVMLDGSVLVSDDPLGSRAR